jgi:acetyl esterase/lipase
MMASTKPNACRTISAPLSASSWFSGEGGGFLEGNKSVPPQLLKECLESGISVAAITYRFSNQAIAPASFQDGARAIQFPRFKAKEWDIDSKRIAATGGSAGAGISLWLGFDDDMAEPGDR